MRNYYKDRNKCYLKTSSEKFRVQALACSQAIGTVGTEGSGWLNIRLHSHRKNRGTRGTVRTLGTAFRQ